MKRLYCLLLLLLPVAGFTQQLVNCAPATPCTVTGPSNTGTGDQAWLAFGKINANFQAVQQVPYGGTGTSSLTGVVKGNGVSPLTAAASGDIIALWTGSCNSGTVLSGAGTCVVAGGGSSAWSTVTGGTNTGQAFLIGTGSSFGSTGSGSITANSYSGVLPQANGGTGTTTSTGTGSAVYAVSPSFTTPNIGAATATTINGTNLPSSAGTLWGSSGAYTVGHCIQVGSTSPQELTDSGSSCGGGGGSGTVNSATAGQFAYYISTGNAVSGGTVGQGLGLSGGVLGTTYVPRVVSGTTDTIASTDCASGVEYTSSSAIAITLPQATGSFATCSFDVIVSGSGTATITPVTSTITNSSSLTGTSLVAAGYTSANITALSGNYVAAGTALGGSIAFNALTGGTNTTAAMLVGTGASLGPTGTGTLTGNAWSNNTEFSGTFTGQAANTAVVGSLIANSTAASSGNQQEMCQELDGHGWGTTGGTSQLVQWQVCNIPIQGATVGSTLLFQTQINGGGWDTGLTLEYNDPGNAFVTPWGITAPNVTLNSPSCPGAGVAKGSVSNHTAICGNSVDVVDVSQAEVLIASGATLEPSAGTTTIAPITFQSGTNLTTPVAGSEEYDGAVPYFTPTASSRGVLQANYFEAISSAYTLTSQTAAQKLLNATSNGTITVPVGTFNFSCNFTLTSMSASSGTFGFALGGTATFTQAWTSVASMPSSTLPTPTASYQTYNTAANTALTAAATVADGIASINGLIRVTVAGTVIPEVSLSVAAAAVVGANSSCTFTPLGSSTVTSVGNWN